MTKERDYKRSRQIAADMEKLIVGENEDNAGFALSMTLAAFVARHRTEDPANMGAYQRNTLEHIVETAIKLIPGFNADVEQQLAEGKGTVKPVRTN